MDTKVDPKFTPGPWEAIGKGVYADFTTPDGQQHCQEVLFGNHNTRSGSDDEQRANARLIAAAPDLLAALEEVASRLLVGCSPETIHELRQQAREAIDKARHAV